MAFANNSSAFGAFGSTASKPLFGQPAAAPQQQQQQQPAPAFGFGQQNAGAAQNTGTNFGGSSIFGQPQQQPQQQQHQQQQNQPTTSSFGQPVQQQPSAFGTGSIFGGTPATNQTQLATSQFGNTTTQAPATNSLFSNTNTNQQPATNSLFTNTNGNQQPTTSLFGNTNTNQQPANSPFATNNNQPTNSMFGASAANSQPTNSYFGASTSNQPIFGASTTNQPQSLFGQNNNIQQTSLFGQKLPQSPVSSSQQAPLFSKATKFNDLPDELKRVFEFLDSHIQGRIQISKDLHQLKLGEESLKGQELIRSVHKELANTVSVVHQDFLFNSDIRAKVDQAVQDTIIATRIVDGFKNPQQNGVHLKNHATFPLEYFARITEEMRHRLRWYKTTIEHIERKIAATANHTQQSPQAISATLQAQHATFIALASKTAAVDAELQKVKELYTQLWRARTRSMRDPFNDIDRASGGDFGISSLQV